MPMIKSLWKFKLMIISAYQSNPFINSRRLSIDINFLNTDRNDRNKKFEELISSANDFRSQNEQIVNQNKSVKK